MLVSLAMQLLLIVGLAWSFDKVSPLEYPDNTNGAPPSELQLSVGNPDLQDSSVDIEDIKRAAALSWNSLHGGWGKRGAENWNRLNAVWGEFVKNFLTFAVQFFSSLWLCYSISFLRK